MWHPLLRYSYNKIRFNMWKQQHKGYSMLSTTLRTTSDLDTLGGGGGVNAAVHHFAALQIMDHHLHVSAILGDGGPNYTHSWLCASQAVTSFPHPHLIEQLFQQSGIIQSLLWVSSIGKGSSITFGHAILADNSPTTNNYCLATASRVFVRLNKDSSNKPAPFTGEERQQMLMVEKPNNGIIDLEEYPLPQIHRLEAPLSTPKEPILKVTVGPQHVNFGRHVDHAFLIQTASHALSLASCATTSTSSSTSTDLLEDPTRSNSTTLLQPTTILASYKAPGDLNQLLHCFNHDKNKICIYASSGDVQTKNKDDRILLLVAEKNCPTSNGPNEMNTLPRSHL